MSIAFQDVACDHCRKVARVDPGPATQLKITVVGSKHVLQFQTPSGSITLPVVHDDGGIGYIEVNPPSRSALA